MIVVEDSIKSGVIQSNLKMDIVPQLFKKAFNHYQIDAVFEIKNNDAEQFGIKRGSMVFVNQGIIPKGGMLLMVKQEERWMIRQLISYGNSQLITTGKEKDKPKNIDEVELLGVITWCCSAKIDYENL
jgi:hypothetical protein